jgi:hypothetical protein
MSVKFATLVPETFVRRQEPEQSRKHVITAQETEINGVLSMNFHRDSDVLFLQPKGHKLPTRKNLLSSLLD